MPNAIYTTTRDGLADLVSRQAADRVLAHAVDAVGSTPEIVDASTMSRLLRGRVRRELERTLPRAGVRRRLAELDARLARERSAAKRPERSVAPGRGDGAGATKDGPTPGRPASAPSEPPAPARRVVRWFREPADVASESERRRAFPVAGDPELAEPRRRSTDAGVPDAPPVAPPATRPAASGPVGPSQASPAATAGATPATTPSTTPSAGTATLPRPTPGRAAPARPASSVPASTVPASTVPAAAPTAPAAPAAARPDRWIDRIAERDAVRQWTWTPAVGRPEGRGDGPPPERVAAALGPLTTVLGRTGTLRSLHVHTDRGHVLVGAVRGATLTIAGDDALNLGAIYATFRALEEES